MYRDSVFYRELGEGFIAEAFQIARAADPDVLLFYNDFGVEGTNGAKANGTFDMVSGLVAAGVPIDGMGFQMHTGPLDQGPNAADFRREHRSLRGPGARGRDRPRWTSTLCSIGTNVLGLELQRFRYNRILSACFDSPGVPLRQPVGSRRRQLLAEHERLHARHAHARYAALAPRVRRYSRAETRVVGHLRRALGLHVRMS